MIQFAIAETAQNQLAKESKINLAQAALMTQDLQALAETDRDDVRRLKDKHLWKGNYGPPTPTPVEGEMPGNIIVCDEYHPAEGNTNTSSSTDTGGFKLILALLIGGLLVGGALLGAKLLSDKPAATPAKNTTSREGFMIELVPEGNGLPK